MNTLVNTSFLHEDEATAKYLPPNDECVDARVELKVTTPTASTSVRIGPRSFTEVTAEHVRFARELVEASKQYLTELERAYEHDRAMDDESQLEAA